MWWHCPGHSGNATTVPLGGGSTQFNNFAAGSKNVKYTLREFVKLHFISAFLIVDAVDFDFKKLKLFGNNVAGLSHLRFWVWLSVYVTLNVCNRIQTKREKQGNIKKLCEA